MGITEQPGYQFANRYELTDRDKFLVSNIRQTERELLLAVYHKTENEYVRDICNKVGQYKQNWHYLEKWTGRDWYEYGVTLDLGWLTPRGEKVAQYLEDKKL